MINGCFVNVNVSGVGCLIHIHTLMKLGKGLFEGEGGGERSGTGLGEVPLGRTWIMKVVE